MLKATPRLQERIHKVEKHLHGLLLQSERGSLLLSPQGEAIVRVCYSVEGAPSVELPLYLLPQPAFSAWTYTETEAEIVLSTKALAVHVNRETAAISYYDNARNLLLADRDTQSRIMEPFDAYRMVVDENTVVEEVETPDGIKRVIKQASSVFDKVLYHTHLHLQWQQGEALYGLGQHEEGSLNLRGTRQYLHQANMKIAIPFLLSSLGYGLLFATGSPSVFSDTQQGTYFYTQADAQMDFYFIAGGSADKVIAGYRALTGKAAMLPRWALGYVQSQERYETQDEILDVVAQYRHRGIGLDLIVLDWCSWTGNLWGQKTFDAERFPDVEAMVQTLHGQDVAFMLSLWPNMHEAGDNYREFLDSGYLLPASNIYNALDEKARALYWEQANRGLFSRGVDAWWCDSSEPWTPEWSHKIRPEAAVMYEEFFATASRYLPAELCNAYGFYHGCTMWDGQRQANANKRVCNLTRNGYLGQQRLGCVLWSGDISATWDTLRKQIAEGLSLCASGIPYWTLDAGGFFVRRGVQWFWDGDFEAGWEDLGYKELAVRWFQYATFLPMMRGHGTDFRREWWNVGDAGTVYYDALMAANKLRYRFAPYLYSLMGGVWLRDETMMRPLVFDFAADAQALEVKDQFLLGPSLMVCPVTQAMEYGAGSTPLSGISQTRQVYLPSGCDWYDYWTNAQYKGGQTITAKAPIDCIPLYVRAGSVLPVVEGAQSMAQAAQGPYIYLVYPGADATFVLYEDAGDGYAYEQGEYALTQLRWEQAAHTLHIGTPQGKFAASVCREKDRVQIITRQNEFN